MRRATSILAASLLLIWSMPANADKPDPDRVIVKFRDGAAERGKSALRAAGATILLELGEHNAAAAHVPPRALEALQKNPNIEYIEQDHPRYPMAQTTPYGIPMVQANQVSDANAALRTVCIIDSGYAISHPDLDSDSSVTGTNDSGTGNWYDDTCSHGTHVAGTIAALNNNVGVLGVMPGGKARLHIVKVFNGTNCGWAYSSSLVNALSVCRNNGANVVSMSLGGSFSSTTENTAFQNAYNAGVLSVAAAGNGGNTRKSYPASYGSVISVAAVDSSKVVADFSQKNDAVELAAPGVGVLSTVRPGTGRDDSLSVGTTSYEAIGMDGSPNKSGTGGLVDCGLGTSTCSGASGKVCLIERGTISFADKVLACQSGGGVAAVIYNNTSGSLNGTLGGTATNIPSVGITAADGANLKSKLGQSATVTTKTGGDYAFYDGTSMATPHVAGVAALVWSHNPSWTNEQLRTALQASAEDLGAAGKDNAYGYGLVRAKAALDLLNGGGSGGGGDDGGGGGGGGGGCDLGQKGDACTADSDCCSNKCTGKAGAKTCK
jgi:serine protease